MNVNKVSFLHSSLPPTLSYIHVTKGDITSYTGRNQKYFSTTFDLSPLEWRGWNQFTINVSACSSCDFCISCKIQLYTNFKKLIILPVTYSHFFPLGKPEQLSSLKPSIYCVVATNVLPQRAFLYYITIVLFLPAGANNL